MGLTAIYANLACSDLGRSRAWYEVVFGRAPDASPMRGLHEWHHGETAALQLHEDAEKAGRGTLTLGVDDVRAERERLDALAPGEVEEANYTTICRLQDPDGNLVVLAQPSRA